MLTDPVFTIREETANACVEPGEPEIEEAKKCRGFKSVTFSLCDKKTELDKQVGNVEHILFRCSGKSYVTLDHEIFFWRKFPLLSCLVPSLNHEDSENIWYVGSTTTLSSENRLK